MGKDGRHSSKHETEKNSKRKIAQALNQIKINRLIRCSNCKKLGHNKLRCVKATHEENSRSEYKNTKEVEDIAN